MATGTSITLAVVTIESPKNNEVVLGRNIPVAGAASCTRERTDIDGNTTTEDLTPFITKVEVKFGLDSYQLATKAGPSSKPWSQWTFTGPMPSSVASLMITAKVTVGSAIDEGSVTVRVGLFKGDLPIALLPVRLETRFVPRPGATDLHIRVYPDEVHIDTHEPELTENEASWGKHFWEQTWRAGNEGAQAKRAWGQLAERFGANRAAWIAKALEPTNPGERPASPVSESQPLPKAPNLREPTRRVDSWTRAPQARLLPERWVALGYRGNAKVFTVWGRPIPDLLHAGPRPGATFSGGDEIRALDEGMRWMVDFDEAVRAGMGLSARLDPTTAQQGLDRLIVLGVKASLDPKVAADRVGALLGAHHYTGGLAFISQGTPSNNTEDAPSGYSAREPDPDMSYAVERGDALPGPSSNAQVTERALGIDPRFFAFAHVWKAGATENLDARHMNAALWSATWDYFLEQMMAETFSDEAIRAARRHFIDVVRARGPLPALRIGSQPYGLLPAISLERWGRLDESELDAKIVGFLRQMQSVWRRSLAQVPRLGRSGDPDQDLLEILGMEAHSRSYAARSVTGRHYLKNLWSFMGINVGTNWWPKQEAMARSVLQTLGLAWNPRVSRATFAPDTFPLFAPLVQEGPLSETVPLSPNYIERLNHGGPQGDRVSVTGLRTEDFITPKPHVLLYLLLRHAALREYASAAFRIQLRRKLLAASDRFEPELVDMDALRPTSTVWSQLARPVQGLTAVKQSVADYLQGLKNSADPDVAELGEFWDSLAYLQNKPSAILEQLFVETLDLCSHRLDAWVTSFATKRLQTLRQKAPTGIYLGGYGWVENLRPAPARGEVKLLPQGEPPPLYISDSNAGYVHAPSLAHAATAAVLRSGFLSHGPAAENPLAIDLSSRRVRLAISLLEGVRQGQPVGALLGYRFERGLHEGHPRRAQSKERLPDALIGSQRLQRL